MFKDIKFIDLFCGIGGFHLALKNYSNNCVFASEIDYNAIQVYKKNFGINSDNDIRDVNPKNLSHYDLLCAGFPCQAFSKAGHQMGFQDETKGTLFFEIERLLSYRVKNNDPVKFFLLENVANLVTHDSGKTWETIKKHLCELGYFFSEEPIKLSPHQFNIPQIRKRVFIFGVHKKFVKNGKKPDFSVDVNYPYNKTNITSMFSILDNKNKTDFTNVSQDKLNVISFWEEFHKIVKSEKLGFPIWLDWFIRIDEPIPDSTPKWKMKIIEKNFFLFKKYRQEITNLNIKYQIENFTPTHRKFEWQAGKDINNIKEGILQFRTSGLRVKRPTEFPALVAMVHKPIIFNNGYRYISISEAKTLQSFPYSYKLDNSFQSYKQLGNSINIDIVKEIFKNFDKKNKEIIS